MQKFAFLTDMHWGYEEGKKPLHNLRAINAVIEFLGDFKPDVIILGGDMLDCGSMSHWNERSKRNIEGLRLLHDAEELDREVIQPLNDICPNLTYILGNHEQWLDQFEDQHPGLDGMLRIPRLLPNFHGKLVPQGGSVALGKLYFIHGDQLRGGEHVAKKAVETYGRNMRLGHFHTAQMYTKMTPIDVDDVKTGIAVPSLSVKGPAYGKGAPNRWSNGFLWGYVQKDGRFTDYLSILVNNRFTAMGKEYKG